MSFFGKIGGFLEGTIALPLFLYGTKGLYDSVNYDSAKDELDFEKPSYGKPASAGIGGLLLTDAARRYSGTSWNDIANGSAYAIEGLDNMLQAYNETI